MDENDNEDKSHLNKKIVKEDKVKKINLTKNMEDIIFRDGLPYRGCFLVTEYCVEGDCSQPECHHCFPVKTVKNIK